MKLVSSKFPVKSEYNYPAKNIFPTKDAISKELLQKFSTNKTIHIPIIRPFNHHPRLTHSLPSPFHRENSIRNIPSMTQELPTLYSEKNRKSLIRRTYTRSPSSSFHPLTRRADSHSSCSCCRSSTSC